MSANSIHTDLYCSKRQELRITRSSESVSLCSRITDFSMWEEVSAQGP